MRENSPKLCSLFSFRLPERRRVELNPFDRAVVHKFTNEEILFFWN